MEGSEKPRDRRGYGQGSLAEIAPGVWKMRILLGRDLLTGKLIQPSRRFRGSRAAAERALNEFRVEMSEKAKVGQIANSRLLLNEIIERHLEASDFAPGTDTAYRSFHKLHIQDGIGRTPVLSIRAPMLRTFYKRLAEERKLSASTIWGIYSLISGSISRAQREDNVPFDRHQLVAPKKPIRKQKDLATGPEMSRILAAADNLGDDWPLLIRLAYATGMRRGELVALRWNSLGADGVLVVQAGIVHKKGGPIATGTKTDETRLVALDGRSQALWTQTRAAREEQLRAVGLPFRDDSYVFNFDLAGTRPRRPDRVSKVWAELRDELGLSSELEFRSTRNWHITVLRDQLGFPLEFIARRVGHTATNQSSLAMTASYTVTTREADRKMAEGAAALLDELH